MYAGGPSRRPDGRAADELRELTVSIGELDRADGSGRFAFGSTAALASCSGPIEVRLREERPDRATLEITHRPLEGVGATPSRALVTTLESIYPPVLTLSKHPRSLVQLVVQSLTPIPTHYSTAPTAYLDVTPTPNVWPRAYEESGAASTSSSYTYTSRAAAVNASTLALLSAGSIPITALPVAVALALSPNGDKAGLVLDPSAEEERSAKARFGFGWAFGVGVSLANKEGQGEDVKMDLEQEQGQGEMEMVWVESEGRFSKEQFSDALELSKIATRQIFSEMREALGHQLEQRQL